MIIAIDPGYGKSSGGCACAEVGDDSRLSAVWFDRASDPLPLSGEHRYSRVIIIEKPQQDARSRGVPPSVLVNLAWEGALLAGIYAGMLGASVRAVTPSEWKGSLPKPQHHARIWDMLDDEERLAFDDPEVVGKAIHDACRRGALDRWGKPGVSYYPRSFVTHNMLDAVGLGLFAAGRTTK